MELKMAKINSFTRKQERREGALNRFSIREVRQGEDEREYVRYVRRKDEERNKLKERLGKS